MNWHIFNFFSYLVLLYAKCYISFDCKIRVTRLERIPVKNRDTVAILTYLTEISIAIKMI